MTISFAPSSSNSPISVLRGWRRGRSNLRRRADGRVRLGVVSEATRKGEGTRERDRGILVGE
ncbi:MAG TPA: hypothetical protein V6D06_04085 [Trichocoleus sp.]